MRYTLKQLQQRKTLCTAQSCNLKIETATMRVWLSRCSVEDGKPYNNKVSVEKLVKGRWVTVYQYQAK